MFWKKKKNKEDANNKKEEVTQGKKVTKDDCTYILFSNGNGRLIDNLMKNLLISNKRGNEKLYFKYLEAINKSVVSAMQLILKAMSKDCKDLNSKELANTLPLELQPTVDSFCLLSKNSEIISTEIANDIKILWQNPQVKSAFDHLEKKELLHQSYQYYFENILMISNCNYGVELKDEDILHCQFLTPEPEIVISTGAVDELSLKVFEMRYQTCKERYTYSRFSLYDGIDDIMIRERGTYYKLSENMFNYSACIFYVDLNDYNETFSSETGIVYNRLQHALISFNEVLDLTIDRIEIYALVFDDHLFSDSLKKTPMTVCFPDYPDVSSSVESDEPTHWREELIAKDDDIQSSSAKRFICEKFEDLFEYKMSEHCSRTQDFDPMINLMAIQSSNVQSLSSKIEHKRIMFRLKGCCHGI
eukprot:Awhi_evm1s383